MRRTEFGKTRTTCGCNECATNCRYMPGSLIPSDLGRMVPPGADSFAWAEANLLASPGALVKQLSTGTVFRIPTLVPAVKADGSCIHLTDEARCAIHAVAPFGCAFFDCRTTPRDDVSAAGLINVMEAHQSGHLYTQIWEHLWNTGKRQKGPEELRALYDRP